MGLLSIWFGASGLALRFQSMRFKVSGLQFGVWDSTSILNPAIMQQPKLTTQFFKIQALCDGLSV